MSGKRAARVAALIQEHLATVLAYRIRDPRVGFATVTHVEVSDDLKYARVFYSVMGDEAQRQKTAVGLEQAKGFFQKGLAQHLKLRFTPHLEFLMDDSYDQGMKIDKIIQKLNEEKQINLKQ